MQDGCEAAEGNNIHTSKLRLGPCSRPRATLSLAAQLLQREVHQLLDRCLFSQTIESNFSVLQQANSVADIEDMRVVVRHDYDGNLTLFLQATDQIQNDGALSIFLGCPVLRHQGTRR
jgi:hypothetical protein